MATYRASEGGMKKAENAFKISGQSKAGLAAISGVSRTTLNNFFAGKSVNCPKFQSICKELKQDWRSIADLETAEVETATPEIDTLVQTIRQQVSADILERCGKMKILDMEQPIEYSDIYTDVNILEKIPGRSRLEFAEVLVGCQSKDFDRHRFEFGRAQGKRLPGLKAVDEYSKLMILGKPGAGKTTFMKRLAMLCIHGNFQGQRVPIFVTLKEFAEFEGKPGILEYIDRQWSSCGVIESAETLLSNGHALVLLDGLDEVRDVDHDQVLAVIKDFSRQYRECLIVITCRIAAREYIFDNFTDVEVADFSTEQIGEFINKWFVVKGDLLKAKLMIDKLSDRKPVQELATNPLLLTLLCLIFGDGSDFPSNRSELYKEGLDVLLKKWDSTRNIERDQVYKKLSLKRKEDLLSRLAFDTFDKGEYFFKKSTAERYIADYICNIPGASDEDLQLDSEAVLRSIMAQHGLLVERANGIFSFSHLTFHEYFAAKRIVNSSIAQGPETFQKLARHSHDQRWHEVFFLVLGMLDDASSCLLIIKGGIDGILAGDQSVQKYLVWLDKKSRDIKEDSTTTHLFYIYLDLYLYLYLYLHDDLSLYLNLFLNQDLYLDLYLYLSLYIDFYLDQAIKKAIKIKSSSDFIAALQKLKSQSTFPTWERRNLADWRKQMHVAMIKYRDIGHDWEFTILQKDNLKKYYLANKLLREFLQAKDECYLTLTTRQYITNTFCRPFDLIPPPPI
jgi:predicted NACHT family NTPase